jgi:hypothetical protein
MRLTDLPELEDGRDVRVVELTGDLRFVDEHLDEVVVLRHRRQNPLDGEELLEAFDAEGLRHVHLRHAANRDALQQQVLAEGDDPRTLRLLSVAPSGAGHTHTNLQSPESQPLTRGSTFPLPFLRFW